MEIPSARLKDHYGQSRIGDLNADRTRNPSGSTGTKQKVIADRGFLANSNEQRTSGGLRASYNASLFNYRRNASNRPGRRGNNDFYLIDFFSVYERDGDCFYDFIHT